VDERESGFARVPVSQLRRLLTTRGILQVVHGMRTSGVLVQGLAMMLAGLVHDWNTSTQWCGGLRRWYSGTLIVIGIVYVWLHELLLGHVS
jgi:hypothetical protein